MATPREVADKIGIKLGTQTSQGIATKLNAAQGKPFNIGSTSKPLEGSGGVIKPAKKSK